MSGAELQARFSTGWPRCRSRRWSFAAGDGTSERAATTPSPHGGRAPRGRPAHASALIRPSGGFTSRQGSSPPGGRRGRPHQYPAARPPRLRAVGGASCCSGSTPWRHSTGSRPPSPRMRLLEGFRWFRATALDAVLVLPGGRTVGVVRQGAMGGRRPSPSGSGACTKGAAGCAPRARIGRLAAAHSRRLLDGLPVPAFLALECDAASAAAHGPVWNTPSGEAAISLHTALSRRGPEARCRREATLRASMPGPPSRRIVTYDPDHSCQSA